MDGKRVLITGGNAGIGWATARELARRGAQVTITSRNEVRGRTAAARLLQETGRAIEVRRLDLASFASIRQFAASFLAQHQRLDVLINNAGVYLGDRRLTQEGFEATFGINHLGPALLTDLMLPALRAAAPSRIVMVASSAHRRVSGMNFGDLQRDRGYRALLVYSESKLANLLYCRALARRLDGTGVSINAVHPGRVASRFAQDGDAGGLVRWFFWLGRLWMNTPEQGAAASVHVASAPELTKVSGRYFVDDHEAVPRPPALDDDGAERLWALTRDWIERARPA